MRRAQVLLLAASLGAGPALAGAGEADAGTPLVPVGRKVRVTSSALLERMEGVVLAVDAETLTVAGGDSPAPFRVPIASILRLELQTGRRRHAWQGLLIGAALGVVVGLAEDVPNCSFEDSSTRSECTAFYAVGMGLMGLGVGALVKTDAWTTLPPPGRSAGGPGAGLGIRVALSF